MGCFTCFAIRIFEEYFRFLTSIEWNVCNIIQRYRSKCRLRYVKIKFKFSGWNILNMYAIHLYYNILIIDPLNKIWHINTTMINSIPPTPIKCTKLHSTRTEFKLRRHTISHSLCYTAPLRREPHTEHNEPPNRSCTPRRPFTHQTQQTNTCPFPYGLRARLWPFLRVSKKRVNSAVHFAGHCRMQRSLWHCATVTAIYCDRCAVHSTRPRRERVTIPFSRVRRLMSGTPFTRVRLISTLILGATRARDCHNCCASYSGIGRDAVSHSLCVCVRAFQLETELVGWFWWACAWSIIWDCIYT